MTTSEMVVSDASPLILLARVGRLDLLRAISSDVLAPPAVWAEATREPLAPGASVVAAATWIRILAPTRPLPSNGTLGAGEREAIALAREHGAILVVDDAAARRRARVEGLRLTGTLGVLVLARRTGHLHAVAPILETMQAQGFRISADLIARTLHRCGEA